MNTTCGYLMRLFRWPLAVFLLISFADLETLDA